MLQLNNIVKNYEMGNSTVEALRGVTIAFRKSEFVSVLGPSGCGKTTLLNIIGGLDRYSSGDLTINGRSTREYKDRDWDTYRNHTIGFVFQTYNLIMHQTVLSNVELALTLSGVSKQERRRRAVEVLTKVGLEDQLRKKPNQMSGGQMQRVAIARALVNNPEIMLADEPTGALDTETSGQIMELLKEIAKDRLVIMVTHNSDLADACSTRIIRLLDGHVTGDTKPYDAREEAEDVKKVQTATTQKTSMSFRTALSLSLTNLLTKKTRTFLTAFAGSIGIIGIALILALQSGAQAYINTVEQDTLSAYPLVIQSQTMDMNRLMSTMMKEMRTEGETPAHDKEKVYASEVMLDMMEAMTAQVKKNDLAAFKTYIDSEAGSPLRALTNDIHYGYDITLPIYLADTAKGAVQVNPSQLFSGFGGNGGGNAQQMREQASMFMPGMSFGGMSANVWTEILDNQELLHSQYNLLAGQWPTSYDQVVLVVDEENEISDMTLYSLGLRDQSEVMRLMLRMMSNQQAPADSQDDGEQQSFTYEELLAHSFKLVIPTEVYTKEDGVWVDNSKNADYMKALLEKSLNLKIAGIVRPVEGAAATSINGTIGYLSALTEYVIGKTNASEIANEQVASPEINVLTGKSFATLDTQEEGAQLTSLATYEGNLEKFGYISLEKPSTISLYPKSFKDKEQVSAFVDAYNQRQRDAGVEDMTIAYTDMVAILMSSVTTIIDAISYILIAFVAISLVVSSLMIGIITYISVLERTKEIGILRSIGASKRDIARVFNAETLIVGFVAGAIGIGCTLLLSIPINAIIYHLADIRGMAMLPAIGAVVLLVLSTILTLIAGLIPSRVAAKKDPVVALRTE